MNYIVGFDLNKTIIKQNTWYDLNLAMGITSQEDEFLFRLGPEGEGILSYREWIDLLVRLMRKRGLATQQNVEKVVMSYEYLDGAQKVINQLKQAGCKVGLITGAFLSLAEEVKLNLGLDFVYSNSDIVYDAEGVIKNIVTHNEDFDFKVQAVKALKGKYGAEAEVFYVADGDNDAEIFKVTKGIIIDPKSIIHEDWKHLSIQKGEEFSHSKSYNEAWKVVQNISEVPDLIIKSK